MLIVSISKIHYVIMTVIQGILYSLWVNLKKIMCKCKKLNLLSQRIVNGMLQQLVIWSKTKKKLTLPS